MKALLIDDSSIMRMMVKSLLKQVDITDISEANNGVEGLSAVESETFDVVFLDLHMPQMDGLTFLKELRARPKHASLPVVVLTSDTEQTQAEEAKRIGASSYVTKPFRVEGLRKALDEAIGT